MALKVFLETKDLTDVLAALKDAAEYVEKRVLPKAGQDASKIIMDEVQARVPIDTRHLYESMGVSVGIAPTPGLVEFRIGPRPGHRWYGVSRGWRGRPKHHDPEEYGWYQEEGFYHVLARRRIAGRRYMRKGFAASRARALAIIRTVIQRGVDEYARAGRVRRFFGRFFGR
jgi:hypothetical protein